MIDFNYGWNDPILQQIGAKEVHYDEHSQYEIEVDSFEDLEALLHIVDSLTNKFYSAVISFDPNTIYLDNTV